MNGNGNLTYKIGLLTADEITFAGLMANIYNSSTYLYENTGVSDWWSLSPGYVFSGSASVLYACLRGLDGINVNFKHLGLRPAISLISSTNVTGDGTSENPYIVEK